MPNIDQIKLTVLTMAVLLSGCPQTDIDVVEKFCGEPISKVQRFDSSMPLSVYATCSDGKKVSFRKSF
jgi:hypothetical protein